MQKIFNSTRTLDQSAIKNFNLTEDILMENAANELLNNIYLQLNLKCIKKNIIIDNPLILILCGSGDNGGDGYALARKFIKNETVVIFPVLEAKTKMCKIQKERAQKAGIKIIDKKEFSKYTKKADVIVDCIFGSGFHGTLPEDIKNIISLTNKMQAIKIACDIPSGMFFNADVTVTMGALKTALFTDEAKEHTGLIVTGNLGINRKFFENNNKHAAFLLEKEDMKLPHRTKQNSHKGTYGHTAVVCGEKYGAGLIASSAALSFGSGLVTAIGTEFSLVFPSEKSFKIADIEVMHSRTFPENTSTVAIGMGLGRNKNINYYLDFLINNKKISACIDADLFYYPELSSLLDKKRNLVLTPHPKEFAELLKICGITNQQGKTLSVSDVQENRSSLVEQLCKKFPGIVVLLKGANVLIGRYTEKAGFELFVNNYGKPCLSKGGSGDVLSGMIAALLAQKYDILQAAISGSLAHALASRQVSSDFGMTPFDLIKCVKNL
jgi:hydroxyethylthiazole kinase-like uncharacterized protein yjeF